MAFKDLTTERHKPSGEPDPNVPHPMKSKQMLSIRSLLCDKMGMSLSAASVTALRAQRSPSPTGYMRKFLQVAIKHQIDKYRMQSFAKFGLDIEIILTPNAMRMRLPVDHFGEITVGYHTYTLRPNHNAEPPKTLRVRLHQGGIQIQFCGSWQPLSAYLNEINTDWTYPAAQHLELDRQYYWWRLNGKSFQFTKLPGEIRNTIFDFAFPSEVQPFALSRCQKRGRSVPTYKRSFTALMRTNKQIYEEASDRFYRTTSFLIDQRQLFSRTLNNRFLRDRLRHLRLTLTHSGYLDLFSSREEELTSKPYVKHQLREMLNLTNLNIHIGPPSRNTEKSWLEDACQKTAVNMIIDAAWPSIRGLPVTITGFVKDSQKRAIEARVQSERHMYVYFKAWCHDVGKCCSLRAYDAWVNGMEAEEQGGVRLDGEAHGSDESGRLEWQNMGPLDLKMAMFCTCKKPCTMDDWDSAN